MLEITWIVSFLRDECLIWMRVRDGWLRSGMTDDWWMNISIQLLIPRHIQIFEYENTIQVCIFLYGRMKTQTKSKAHWENVRQLTLRSTICTSDAVSWFFFSKLKENRALEWNLRFYYFDGDSDLGSVMWNNISGSKRVRIQVCSKIEKYGDFRLFRNCTM